MIYPFRCSCGAYTEVYRPAKDCSLPQTCTCGATMDRVYTMPYTNVENVEGFDPGLGVYVRNKAHKREVLKRINYKTGQNLVEVGNEKVKVTPKKHDYTVPYEAMNRITK